MKFTVQKRDIVDILSKIQGLTGRKSNLIVTENVLIKSADEKISLMATDLETGFEGTYPAIIEKPGVIAINARKLFEIIKEFPSEDIVINEVENNWVEISNKKINYHIVSMNPEDFPDNPLKDDISFFEIESVQFKKMIEKSLAIMGASDDKRAHIKGVFFERIVKGDEKKVRFVSTDGSRLARIDYIYENGTDLKEGPGILIPKKGLVEINKFIESEGILKIGFKKNNFIIKKDSETIIVRLLEGDFPQYEDILKIEKSNIIKLEKTLFSMMLRRMSILTNENYKGVIFNFEEGKITITTTNPDIGESKEDMTIDYKGEPISVSFNPKYFIDILNVIEDENVMFYIIDEDKPCLIEGENDKNFLSVIMPMRI
ncbi:MAG: DNA polymerase III subunit beta [Desulfobacterales bacterium]|nr:DNA polymerase III subunit beta [Desulfobacterales bacterium]